MFAIKSNLIKLITFKKHKKQHPVIIEKSEHVLHTLTPSIESSLKYTAQGDISIKISATLPLPLHKQQ